MATLHVNQLIAPIFPKRKHYSTASFRKIPRLEFRSNWLVINKVSPATKQPAHHYRHPHLSMIMLVFLACLVLSCHGATEFSKEYQLKLYPESWNNRQEA